MSKLDELAAELAASGPSFDLERFRTPAPVDRPVPFYSWNERMEPAELRRQVDLIADGGWGGAFIHSRIGLLTPYLGDEWFAAVDATIDQCRKRGLKAWLYDEDKWPSGYSGGAVPLTDKAFRMQALIARPQAAQPPPGCEPLGDPCDGLQIHVWTAPLGDEWFNGTCYSSTLHERAMATFIKEAYEAYHARYAELYGSVIVGEFTDEPCPLIRAKLPHGCVPFTPGLPERFEEMHGYAPQDCYHLLFRDTPEAAQFRIHYFRTVNDMFERNYSRQIGEWCGEHGIALTGHYINEDSVFAQQLYGIKIMPNYRHQGIPGIDHLCRHVSVILGAKQCQSVANQYGRKRVLSELYGADGGSLSFEDRAWIAGQQMALGVNLLNPHLSLYTMAGCRKRDYPQNIFYQQPFWPLNHVLDDRLSRACAALAQGVYRAEALVIHPCESAFSLWQSAVPEENGGALLPFDHMPVTPEAKAKVDQIDAGLRAVMDALLAAQRTFDLGDETIIADDARIAIVDDMPVVRIGCMDYPAVIIPPMHTIAETTLNLLRGFAAAGGHIVRVGDPPALLDGVPDPRLGKFTWKIPKVAPENLSAALSKVVPPMIVADECEPEDRARLYAHVRDLADGARLVYMVNLNRERAFDTRLQLAGPFRGARRLNTQTGEDEQVAVESGTSSGQPGITIPVHFEPAQDHLLLLDRRDRGSRGIGLVPAPVSDERTIDPATWTVERLDDNTLTLDLARWKAGPEDWSARPVPIIGIQEFLNSARYDGPVTLQFSVWAQGLSQKRKVHLVVEYPERYLIRVNDRTVRYAGLPAWRDFRWRPIDITGMLRDGGNTIDLHCEHFQYGDQASTDDTFRRYGTEIESIYLVGDFNVTAKPLPDKPVAEHWKGFGLPPVGVQCFAPESFMLIEPKPLAHGDTTVQGLPFYAGRLRLQTTLPDLPMTGRWYLRAGRLDCPIAEVAVQGGTVGHFMCHPLEIDISDAALSRAKELTVTLYGTLRNLLGPHHHPEGELAVVGPEHFSAEPARDEKGRNVWALRHAAGKPVRGYVDRYCMVTFGDLGDVKVVCRPE